MQQTDDRERTLWLQWLTRLRWVAIVAQIITLGFAWSLLDSPLLLLPLSGVIVALTLANLRALQVLSKDDAPVGTRTLLWQLSVDVLALTTFFLLGGGPENPFTTLYFVHIAMAAVMMPPRFAAALTVLVCLCYGVIHLTFLPLHFDNHVLSNMALVTIGQLGSFLVTAVSVAVFVVGLANTLRYRKRQLLEARDRTARTDRLRSVGTLAAGAAHELNTPLSTLGLRLRRVTRRHQDDDTQKDVKAMKDQLDRCSEIVQQLLVGAGDPSAAGMEQNALAEFTKRGINLWQKSTPIEAVVTDDSAGVQVELPAIAFVQALINLLENARQAQATIDSEAPLQIRIYRDDDMAVIDVRDHGCGLPSGDQAQQVGDPFFTTKPTGTGLGVFVARAMAEGAGGGLRYIDHPDGTTARWWFPITERRSG